MFSAWLLLIVAGVCEICWSVGLKYSDGGTRWLPMLFTVLAMGGSMYLLSRAAQQLPIGTAYAVLVGMGVVGSTTLGIILFHETASMARLGFMVLLLVAIAGLKLTS